MGRQGRTGGIGHREVQFSGTILRSRKLRHRDQENCQNSGA